MTTFHTASFKDRDAQVVKTMRYTGLFMILIKSRMKNLCKAVCMKC